MEYDDLNNILLLSSFSMDTESLVVQEFTVQAN